MERATRIKEALFNRPWAIREEWLDTIVSIYDDAVANGRAPVEDFAQRRRGEGEDPSQPRFEGGAAVIPIQGPIAPKMNLFTAISGGTSLDVASAQLDNALTSQAQGVILDIDSPGGNVQGVPEFANRIARAARESDKPIVASVSGQGASAAYWIASHANLVTLTEASEVGSIGVVAVIRDRSRAMKNEGVDEEVFRSTELKAPGAGPLTPRQRSSVQEDVQLFFRMFKDAVSSMREVDLDEVATGETFVGDRAVELNLADGVGSLEEQIRKFS